MAWRYRCQVTGSVKCGRGVDMTLLATGSPLTGPPTCSLDLSYLWSTVQRPLLPPRPTFFFLLRHPRVLLLSSLSLSHLSMIMSPSDSKSRKSAGGQEIRHCCFPLYRSLSVNLANPQIQPWIWAAVWGESNWVVANNWISCCLV